MCSRARKYSKLVIAYSEYSFGSLNLLFNFYVDFYLFTFVLVNINGNRLKQFSLAADFRGEGIFVVGFLLVVNSKRVDGSVIARAGALNGAIKISPKRILVPFF